MPKPLPLGERAFVWYDPRTARGRLVVSLMAGTLTTLGLGTRVSWATRLIAGWDAAAIVLIVLAWWIIAEADPAETKRRAGAEDPGRTAVWLLVLMSSAVSLFAGTVVLRRARVLAPEESGVLAALSLAAVSSAWVLTHTAYTLRYARLYYRDDEQGIGGLTFPGDRPPDDVDFAYFAFTIGMCFQVSDVTITSHILRRYVLMHALISFAYNTAIVALALNLVFGLLE